MPYLVEGSTATDLVRLARGFISHRIAAYIAIVPANIGYVFFPFMASFVFCVIACAGCCCVIPDDPDDEA